MFEELISALGAIREDCKSSSGKETAFDYGTSEGAVKAAQTRKAHGWNPNVGFAEMNKKIPTWHKPNASPNTGIQTPPPTRETELSRLATARSNYNQNKTPGTLSSLVSAASHIWDDRGRRNYFEN